MDDFYWPFFRSDQGDGRFGQGTFKRLLHVDSYCDKRIQERGSQTNEKPRFHAPGAPLVMTLRVVVCLSPTTRQQTHRNDFIRRNSECLLLPSSTICTQGNSRRSVIRSRSAWRRPVMCRYD